MNQIVKHDKVCVYRHPGMVWVISHVSQIRLERTPFPRILGLVIIHDSFIHDEHCLAFLMALLYYCY